MSNIPYPDVPPLPGVPPLSRAANQGIAVGLAVAAELYALYLKFKNTPKKYPKEAQINTIWGVLFAASFDPNNPKYVLTQSSVKTATISSSLIPGLLNPTTKASSVNVTGLRLVGTYALSPDSFVDFEYKEDHKIPNYPIQNGGFQSYNKIALPYEIKLTIAQGNSNYIATLLMEIQALVDDVQILSIVTPDKIYPSVNLIHFDYKKQATNGAVLLIANLTFQEVKVIVAPSKPCSSPNSATATINGQVSCKTPTVKIDDLIMVN